MNVHIRTATARSKNQMNIAVSIVAVKERNRKASVIAVIQTVIRGAI